MSRQLAQITFDIAGEAASQGLSGAEYHGNADGGFGIFMSGMLRAAMVIALILVFVFLIWGGVEWITSAGDKGKAEGARNKISNAIIGAIVLAATLAVFILLQEFLDINVLTFT
jgi:hypothetical protein